MHSARPRSSSGSSSSSDWETSSHSSGDGRSRRSNRGRRDFAERKELRAGNTPPLPPAPPVPKGKVAEPPKVSFSWLLARVQASNLFSHLSFQVVESKQQIKLTLKAAAPALKKVANKFNDDSDDEGIFRCGPCVYLLLVEHLLFLQQSQLGRRRSLTQCRMF